MSEKKEKKKIDKRPIAFCVLSFFMAVCLFLISVCISLRVTLLSQDYMLSTMAEHEYYGQVTEEFREQLDSLGHASGLTTEFVNEFVASMDIREDVIRYIDAFYSGSSTVVNKTPFKQKFRAALDSFAEQNQKEGTEPSEEALEYLTNEAAELYANSVEIPFFALIANFIYKLTAPMTIAIAALAVIAVVLGVIMFLANPEFKHRGYRYLSYAFSAAFICTVVIPAIMTATGIIGKVNLTTMSLYNLFVNYFNGMLRYMWLFAGVYLFFGILCFIVFANKHRRLLHNH